MIVQTPVTHSNHGTNMAYAFPPAMCIFYILVVCCNIVNGETLSQVDSLLDTLFSDYNKKIRGTLDQTAPTDVNISIKLFSVESLDVVEQTFSAVVVVSTEWFDERLMWKKSDHNNTSEVTVPQSDIWTPELALTNPSKTVTRLGQDYILTHVSHTGEVVWNVGDVLTSSCAVTVVYYPFDTQTCSYTFAVTGRYPSEVRLLPGPVSLAMTENEQWQLTGTTVTTETNFAISSVTFSFTLKRRPTFVFVSQICPILLIGFLNICVFLIPPDSGERISFCITVLLSLAVFLSIIGGNLPSNSQTMAIVCYFLLFVMILSTITCVVVIINLRLYIKDDEAHPVPEWIISLMLKCKCLDCCAKRQKIADVNDSPEFNDKKTQTEVFTWKSVSSFFDNVCLKIMTAAFITTSLIFISVLAFSS